VNGENRNILEFLFLSGVVTLMIDSF